ncbi:DUF6090 family protein [Neolewinella agarilytica]|uniref:Uncharacterized protein n=1 Tax=Neolewinella agarilytica TaxID=478744 RepID=A0A1H9L8Z0_9BACT|nr:DUF6090 family protein [Neolewinella agarilytica]SER07820.1 hypothetical protein SAMN05444359_12356 [Neolewinella agarilytica]
MIANKITPPASSRLGWILRALLEIVIIVFGILLSLWISNGFQNTQDRQRAERYMVRLDNNLKKDEVQLTFELARREEQLGQAKKMLAAVSTPWSSDKVSTMVEGFQSLLWTTRFNSNNATFRSLESSGDLRLIEQDSLVNQIVKLYHNQYEALRENNEDVTKYRDNFLLPYTIRNISFRQSFNPTGSPVTFTAKQLDELYNHLVYETITLQSTVESYRLTMEKVKELRESLQHAMR